VDEAATEGSKIKIAAALQFKLDLTYKSASKATREETVDNQQSFQLVIGPWKIGLRNAALLHGWR
jgi:hypothetical protein